MRRAIIAAAAALAVVGATGASAGASNGGSPTSQACVYFYNAAAGNYLVLELNNGQFKKGSEIGRQYSTNSPPTSCDFLGVIPGP
jgi:hypothetical protein